MSGTNWRNGNGQFAVGNPGGPGNPHAVKTAKLRAKLLEAVTETDIAEIVAKLISMAKGGDLAAIGMLLDRVLGKPLVGVAVATMEREQASPMNAVSLEERQSRLLEIMRNAQSRVQSAEPAAEVVGPTIDNLATLASNLGCELLPAKISGQ